MYFRCSKSKQRGKVYRSYQLVCCHRHPETGRPTTKVHASLGDLSKFDESDQMALVGSLARVLGFQLENVDEETLATADASGVKASAESAGAVWAILELLRQIHLPQVWADLTSDRRNDTALAQHLTALICHRICDPGSKLSLLRWLETVWLPGIDKDEISYDGLLRTMDVLLEHKEELERQLGNRVLTLFDSELDLVLMDATSVSTTSEAEDHALFAHGYSRDGHPERQQYVLMLVTTKDGLPLYHEVYPGNSADVSLVEETAQRVRKLFPQLDRCLVVGDRGMLSRANVEALGKAGFEYLLAAPLKRENEIREVIRQTHEVLVERAEGGEDPVQAEVTIEDSERRLVVIYSRRIAESQREGRHGRLEEFRELVDQTIERVEGKGARRLSSETAFRRFVAELTRRKTTAFFRVGLAEDGNVEIHELEDVHRYADQCDGKLVVETNNWTLIAEELEGTYRDLQEIERSFRSLKSQLGIRPTFHWTERRVRAHVFLCVLGLLVERMMRLRLWLAFCRESMVSVYELSSGTEHELVELLGLCDTQIYWGRNGEFLVFEGNRKLEVPYGPRRPARRCQCSSATFRFPQGSKKWSAALQECGRVLQRASWMSFGCLGRSTLQRSTR